MSGTDNVLFMTLDKTLLMLQERQSLWKSRGVDGWRRRKMVEGWRRRGVEEWRRGVEEWRREGKEKKGGGGEEGWRKRGGRVKDEKKGRKVEEEKKGGRVEEEKGGEIRGLCPTCKDSVRTLFMYRQRCQNILVVHCRVENYNSQDPATNEPWRTDRIGFPPHPHPLYII